MRAAVEQLGTAALGLRPIARRLDAGTLTIAQFHRALTRRVLQARFARLAPCPAAPGGLLAPIPLLAELPEPSVDEGADLDTGYEALLAWTPRITAGRYELVAGDDRRRAGAYYTPPGLIEVILTETLDPLLAAAPTAADVLDTTVCDPACGSGRFLLAAGRRIVDRLAALGGPADWSVVRARCLYGVDVDPVAVELAGASLWLAAPRPGTAPVVPGLRVGDALTGPLDGRGGVGFAWRRAFPEVFARGGFRAVVGNPPFRTQLASRTAATAAARRRVRASTRAELGAYTDDAAVFLARSVQLLGPGGRLGLVQPQSVLAARDAAGVRAYAEQVGSLTAFWWSPRRVFGAGVTTAAVMIVRGAEPGPIRCYTGPDFAFTGTVAPVGAAWATLIAHSLGVPPAVDGPPLATVAECTADFRDQYYGLVEFVQEGCGTPLITTGLVDVGTVHWGTRPTRYGKTRWQRPVVDLAALAEADAALGRWARARLVPKVLVATQGQVLEAVADPAGEYLPCVPMITVTPRPGTSVWQLLAVLLAPPVTAAAYHLAAGAALASTGLKVAARQVATLPLPGDAVRWRAAADLLAADYRRGSGNSAKAVRAAAESMTRAYGLDADVHTWWAGRAAPLLDA